VADSSLSLDSNDALIVVDVQRDFCPGGALAVPDGDHVVGVLNAWLDTAARVGATVVASRDWHPRDHVSFASRGGPWPEHCVRGTRGAELHPELDLPAETVLLSKGQDPNLDNHSAFDGTGLTALLEARGVRRVFVGGLAQDVCVRATVLDALHEGFETHLIVDATRPLSEHDGHRALREMQERGAILHLEARPPSRVQHG
jgi:nicotinamidase/pyrazinamidase